MDIRVSALYESIKRTSLSRFEATHPSAMTRKSFFHCNSAFVKTVSETQTGVQLLARYEVLNCDTTYAVTSTLHTHTHTHTRSGNVCPQACIPQDYDNDVTTIMMTKMMMLMPCIKTFPPTLSRIVPETLQTVRCIVTRQGSETSGPSSLLKLGDKTFLVRMMVMMTMIIIIIILLLLILEAHLTERGKTVMCFFFLS